MQVTSGPLLLELPTQQRADLDGRATVGRPLSRLLMKQTTTD